MKRLAFLAVGNLLLALACPGGPSSAHAQPAADGKLAEQVKVVLEKNCGRCHGVTKQTAFLDVRDHKALLAVHKNSRGKVRTFVVPGDLKKSLLWARI